MSDALIACIAAVVAWALYLLRDVVLRQRRLALDERQAIRLEALMEREQGVVAQLKRSVEACEKAVVDMGREQKTFMANARSTR
jgi:uncharacterized protein YlxW (UPF0749 family)